LPLVYLAATPAGSLALVVHREAAAEKPDAACVETVWADDFTAADLRELLVGPADGPALGGWLGAYQLYKQRTYEVARLKAEGAPEDIRKDAEKLLSIARQAW